MLAASLLAEKSTNTSAGLRPVMRCASTPGSSDAASTAPADTSVSASQRTCASFCDAQTK
jgi:hypothetical protein